MFDYVDLSDLEQIWTQQNLQAMIASTVMQAVQSLAQRSRHNIQSELSEVQWLANSVDSRAGSGLLGMLAGVLQSPGRGTPVEEERVLELHLLSDDALGWAVYHPSTHTLFRLDNLTAATLGRYLNGDPLDVTDTAQVAGWLAQARAVIVQRPALHNPTLLPNRLPRLVMNVSNDCNMRCRYCYAVGGHYQRERMLMSPEIARCAVERFFAYFSHIGMITFFGGEPSLNLPAIQAACERIQEFREHGLIQQVPVVGMVTNGLILDPALLGLIARYGLKVTISLDGPTATHDLLRLTLDGRPAFERISANIRAIQSVTSGHEPSAIEMVYTAEHRKAGLSVADLNDFIKQTFGISETYILPVAVVPENALYLELTPKDTSMVSASAARVVESWSIGEPRRMLTVSECLSALVTHQSQPYLCPAGLSSLVVFADGEVYPCYRLMHADLRIGRVDDPDLFKTERFQAIRAKFDGYAKRGRQQCCGCWARNLCRMCIARAEMMDGTVGPIPDQACAWNQAIARGTLLGLSRLQAEPQAWSAFCTSAQRMVREAMQQRAAK